MNPPSRSGGSEDGALEVLWEDGERVFCRTWREGAEGRRHEFMAVTCAGEQPTPGSIGRLTHEYGLKDHLDAAWALRPLDLVHERGQAILLLEPTRGEPLGHLIGRPMEVGRFLRLAVALSAALGRLHERGLIHKDIKPTNILVDVATDQIRLTGFGIASRLPRERQAPGPPEVIAGTLAYMAPEQTGRMNRSIDSRSDLYALGVTFYEMLTGSLPFAASDPMEWVHCHIARQAVAPGERASGIPEALSSIVMKLLAKTAEERYQTAAGVEADLRRCLSEWQAHGRIDPFPVGAHDASDRLLIAEELYGRETEIATLLAAFDRVVTRGAPELVLVSGYSGVGKSSVVNELHKALVPQRGLFAAGKFDQYKRDIPYATLAQAFQTLDPPNPRQERSGSGAVAGRPDARRSAGRGSSSSTSSPNWSSSSGNSRRSRPAAAGRAEPVSICVPALSRRLRPAGASARVVPRRSAMARRRHARPHRASGHACGGRASAAGRCLSGQRGRSRSRTFAQCWRRSGRRMRGWVRSCWRPSGLTMSAGWSPAPCAATSSARGLWRSWFTKRPAAILSSRSNS